MELDELKIRPSGNRPTDNSPARTHDVVPITEVSFTHIWLAHAFRTIGYMYFAHSSLISGLNDSVAALTHSKTQKYLFPRGNEPLLYHQIGNINFFISITNQ